MIRLLLTGALTVLIGGAVVLALASSQFNLLQDDHFDILGDDDTWDDVDDYEFFRFAEEMREVGE